MVIVKTGARTTALDLPADKNIMTVKPQRENMQEIFITEDILLLYER